jgi:hypothetical protein
VKPFALSLMHRKNDSASGLGRIFLKIRRSPIRFTFIKVQPD